MCVAIHSSLLLYIHSSTLKDLTTLSTKHSIIQVKFLFTEYDNNIVCSPVQIQHCKGMIVKLLDDVGCGHDSLRRGLRKKPLK